MKKFLVMCLALMMVCSAASAAAWLEGLGPQKPYTGKPEVDFNETIGYMMLLPTKGSTVQPETDTLKIFLPREDVEVVSGTMSLCDADTKAVVEMEVTPETLVKRPMTEEELEALLWGSGTVFEIALPQPLEEQHSYYVLMSEGCLKAPDYEAISPAIAEETMWTFDTKVETLVTNVVYYRTVEDEDVEITPEEVQAGDKVSFSVNMGEKAVEAAVYCDAGTIQPAMYHFEEAVETYITFPAAGEVEWGIVFIGPEGELVDDVVFQTTVAEP